MNSPIKRKLRMPLQWNEKDIQVGKYTITLSFTGTPNVGEFQNRCDKFEIKNLTWKSWVSKDKNSGSVVFYKQTCYSDCEDDETDYEDDEE